MSTIIIRLQNLPLSAKAADIREFFGDLKIPKGSVNIVGGHLGDAFIGFASDEDARLAMLLDGRLLHNSKIRLMLSSKREMEQVISSAQAFAGKGASMNQTENNQNTFSPPDPSQKESTVKLEAPMTLPLQAVIDMSIRLFLVFHTLNSPQYQHFNNNNQLNKTC
uniref:RRM domain-containing protein n=1 Tax=Meloidogyne incognita TaxID=6306 RepID=A0A914KWB4_MELIC